MSKLDSSVIARPAARIFSGLSDDEAEVLAQADRFARAELHPLAQRMDDEEWWPRRHLQR
jgi:isovaleryl-CoA dehydrogenase